MDFNALLRSCTSAGVVKRLHALLLVSGSTNDVSLSRKLVQVYSDLGDRHSSILLSDQNIFAWNSLISGYARRGHHLEALSSFHRLVTETSLRPDAFTFPPALKSCELPADGRRLHAWILKLGLQMDLYASTSLVHAYSRWGLVPEARKVFDNTSIRDIACWNAMVAGLCQNGCAAEALSVFEEMLKRVVGVDPVTVSSILPVCAPSGNLTLALSMHALIIKRGFDEDIFVANALIDAYAKSCSLPDARKMFDTMPTRDLISWNSMISAYEQTGDPASAFELYYKLKECSVAPDVLTLVSLASATSQIGNSRNGKSVHASLLRRGSVFTKVFVGNAIVDMYSKLDDMDYARKMFEAMPTRDVISWNTLIAGYTQNGSAGEAIGIFQALQEQEAMTPSHGTIVAILPAYAHVGSLHQGTRIHGLSIRTGFQSDIFISTCLIDMYAKCGRLKEALVLFFEEPRRSSIPWNAIISGHGIHGFGADAVDLFWKMEELSVKPDQVTFISLLSACSHAGLVYEGQRLFQIMNKKYGIKPTRKHYACVVDLLGRAGDLFGAHDCIRSMPMDPDASVWGALLGACRIHGNVQLGELAFEKLSEIDPENVGYYVLLSNMYARVRKWQGVDVVRSLVKNRGLKKTPGWTSLELGNKVHVFFTGSFSHPKSEEIYKELRVLLGKMKALGYVPDYDFVLQDVEEDEKEHILLSHSERLAIAFAIINFPPQAPISIFKNLRVCGDCHAATKFISVITEREIIVRDSTRFHHFKEGRCSCGDYW